MPVNRYWIPVIMITALLGTVLGAQLLGYWSTSGRTSANLEDLSPEDLKGWMTLQQVADGLGLTLEEVYQVGGIPADTPPDSALKDLEDVIEVSTLRERLAEYIAGESVTQIEDPEPTPDPTVEHTGDGTGPTPLPPGEILPAAEIRGRMTLREVSDQCAVDLDALLVALNLPSDIDPDTEIKTLTQDGTLDEVTQVQDAVASLQNQ